MEKEPKYKPLVDAADSLSLGLSIVVAILIGVAMGYGLWKSTDLYWLLWVGVAIGIGAAINNIAIAYRKQKRALDALANDPRYNKKIRGKVDDEDDDDPY